MDVSYILDPLNDAQREAVATPVPAVARPVSWYTASPG